MTDAVTNVEAPARRASRRRKVLRFLPWIVVLMIIGTVGVLTEGQQEDELVPFSPTSTEPDGTRAMQLLAERFGSRFEVSNTAPRDGVAVVLNDTLDQPETARVDEWVRAGGTLVVADLRSSFTGSVRPAQVTARGSRKLQPNCNSPATAGVQTVTPDPNRNYKFLELPPGELAESICFTDSDPRKGFMVTARQGAGRTIVLGNPDIFTNGQIGEADNSVLVANLLDIRPGRTVTFLEGRSAFVPSGGVEGPLDLLPTGARAVLWQLAVAGLALIVWKMRRHGRPVHEEALVEVPASSLVIATGTLREASGREAHASEVLRADLRRTICDRLGVPESTDDATLAAVAHHRTGVDEERMLAALAGPKASSGNSLVELAQEIEDIYQEVVRGR